MASAEAEAYRDSFINWVRFNHRDIPSAFIYVTVCAVLLGLALVGNDLANHFLVNHVTPCGTIDPTCALHHVSYRVHAAPTHLLPTYTPPP